MDRWIDPRRVERGMMMETRDDNGGGGWIIRGFPWFFLDSPFPGLILTEIG